jgi:hypothetical protein
VADESGEVVASQSAPGARSNKARNKKQPQMNTDNNGSLPAVDSFLVSPKKNILVKAHQWSSELTASHTGVLLNRNPGLSYRSV